jgi:hypothetical protein
MKNNFIGHFALLLAVITLASCQKSITESSAIKGSGTNTTSKLPDASLKNQCQLTFAVDWNSNPNWFHYNNEGLADEWQFDYGSGINDVFSLEYDNSNRLSHSDWHFDGALIATIDFVWSGNHISSENWDQGGFLFDVVNTYDQKGQLIKRDASYGLRAEVEYSPDGNPIRYVAYFDNQILGSDVLTYNQPNRNPFLAAQGLPYGFPYAAYVFGKRHETSDIYTDYSSGAPVVGLDTYPAQTVMQMTNQNYVSSVTFFDNVSQSFKIRNFEYQNCGPANNASAGQGNSSQASKSSADKKSIKRSMFLLRNPADIRRQIKASGKQHLGKD